MNYEKNNLRILTEEATHDHNRNKEVLGLLIELLNKGRSEKNGFYSIKGTEYFPKYKKTSSGAFDISECVLDKVEIRAPDGRTILTPVFQFHKNLDVDYEVVDDLGRTIAAIELTKSTEYSAGNALYQRCTKFSLVYNRRCNKKRDIKFCIAHINDATCNSYNLSGKLTEQESVVGMFFKYMDVSVWKNGHFVQYPPNPLESNLQEFVEKVKALTFGSNDTIYMDINCSKKCHCNGTYAMSDPEVGRLHCLSFLLRKVFKFDGKLVVRNSNINYLENDTFKRRGNKLTAAFVFYNLLLESNGSISKPRYDYTHRERKVDTTSEKIVNNFINCVCSRCYGSSSINFDNIGGAEKSNLRTARDTLVEVPKISIPDSVIKYGKTIYILEGKAYKYLYDGVIKIEENKFNDFKNLLIKDGYSEYKFVEGVVVYNSKYSVESRVVKGDTSSILATLDKYGHFEYSSKIEDLMKYPLDNYEEI